MKRIKKHIGTHHISTPKSFIIVALVLISGGFSINNSIKLYGHIFQTDISIEKDVDVDFSEPIYLNFSQPVMGENLAPIVNPAMETEIIWIGNKRLAVVPKEPWRAETDYEITVPAATNAMMVNVPEKTVRFSTKGFPNIISVLPENGTVDTIIDIEDPITIDLDRGTDGFLLKFKIDPPGGMVFQNNPEKTQFKLLPKSKLADSTVYNFKVFIKQYDDPDDSYREIYSSAFKTPPPADIVWDKDYASRLEQAKRYTSAKIYDGKYIDINLKSQVLSRFEDGQVLSTHLISSGKRGMDTPKGEHKIYNKTPRAWSKQYGLYMPYWMAILPDGKVGLHELPEWPGGYKEGASHLGIPVSHGCVRLGIGSAKEIYEWADIGTPVVVY